MNGVRQGSRPAATSQIKGTNVASKLKRTPARRARISRSVAIAEARRRKPAKSVWVQTFETEDSFYIVIQAKRKPEKA